MRDDLTAIYVRSLLSYDPADGKFVWRPRPREMFQKACAHGVWNRRYAGAPAGMSDRAGYVTIKIGRSGYKAHRLAWLYVNGVWPVSEIDHINGERGDNRIANLRECTRAENCQNKSAKRTSRASHIGVGWNSACNKWSAQICCNGKQYYLGVFKRQEDAARAYAEAKARLHTFNPTVRASA